MNRCLALALFPFVSSCGLFTSLEPLAEVDCDARMACVEARVQCGLISSADHCGDDGELFCGECEQGACVANTCASEGEDDGRSAPGSAWCVPTPPVSTSQGSNETCSVMGADSISSLPPIARCARSMQTWRRSGVGGKSRVWTPGTIPSRSRRQVALLAGSTWAYSMDVPWTLRGRRSVGGARNLRSRRTPKSAGLLRWQLVLVTCARSPRSIIRSRAGGASRWARSRSTSAACLPLPDPLFFWPQTTKTAARSLRMARSAAGVRTSRLARSAREHVHVSLSGVEDGLRARSRSEDRVLGWLRRGARQRASRTVSIRRGDARLCLRTARRGQPLRVLGAPRQRGCPGCARQTLRTRGRRTPFRLRRRLRGARRVLGRYY